MKINYAKGTTLEVRRIGCKHLGIATGDGNAIHNFKKEKRVVESPLSEFADGEQIEVNDKITSENMPLACERARLLKGDAYDVILNNSEHLVHYVHGKGKKSPQLQRAAIVVGGAWAVTDKRMPLEFKRPQKARWLVH